MDGGELPWLIFDGDCGFCTRTVLWLLPRLKRPVRVVPWQQLDLEAFGLSEEDVRRYVWWIAPPLRERGHRASARALIALGAPWSPLGRFLLWPPGSWAGALGYWLVARYRRYLPGTTPACRRPEWSCRR